MDVMELFRSCRSGDVETVRHLIETKDVELNVRDNWDSTPLYYACLCGHEELVELLLKNGSRCEANTFDGERCLYGALTDKIRKILRRYNAINSQFMRRDSYNEFLRRSFDQGSFTDLYFVVQKETVSAHRIILAARSSYFATMLQTKWKDKACLFPKRLQINPAQFRDILKYLYTGRLDIPLDECDAYLFLAHHFKLYHVENVLKRRMVNAKSFGASKGGLVKITMITIDPGMEGKDLKDDFANVAEMAMPEPFRSEQFPDGSLGISRLCGEVDYDFIDFSSFADICFNVSDYQFFCHKVFICNRSDYFKALFEFSETAAVNDISCGDTELARIGHCCQITIHDVSPAVFSVVIAFLYTDTAEISPNFDQIYDILCAADMYLLNGLKRLCSNAMSQIFDVHNVIDAVRVSRTFNISRLESDCCRYIAGVLDQIIDDPCLAEMIVQDAKTIEGRQETDSIPLVDDIRYHLYNALLPSYSCNEGPSPELKLELLDNLLKNLGLDC